MNFQERLESFASTAFQELRPAQLQALEAYEQLSGVESDIGIELPTGAGKTLIALLIADRALELGQRVAYLTGTKQLSNQVIDQAALLPGLDAYQFSGKSYPGPQLLEYNQAQAMGVMNYWVYFNSSPRVDPADLIIFDDAHLAEQAMSGMFTLKLLREAGVALDLYRLICDLLLEAAPGTYPTLQALRDGATPSNNPPELIAFADWSAVAPTVYKAVEDADLKSLDNGAFYVWRTIRHNLQRCGVLVGPSGIEIRPYHVPAQAIPGYAKSRARVYLSATLGQPGDIQRRLGTHDVSATPSVELSPGRLGRRTFLINPGLEAASAEATWNFAMDQVQEAAKNGAGRVAWLCASNVEALTISERLEDLGYAVFRLQTGDDSAVDQWKGREGAHLVTAGRFDGLDFPDDVCRLVIIPTVPAASTEFERFVVAYLGDASYMRYRVGQRLTQALGRANRTPNDSAMYIGLDPAFGPALADPAVQAALGPDIRQAVKEGFVLHGGSWQAVREAALQFWQHDTTPVETVELARTAGGGRQRPGRQAGGVGQVDSASSEVRAATKLWLGDFTGAAAAANEAAELLQGSAEIEHAAFWKYIRAHALYERKNSGDEARSREALQSAVEAAPQTAWFVRLQRTIDAMAGRPAALSGSDRLFLAWDEWIREGGTRLASQIDRSRDAIDGKDDRFVEALTVLGRLSGTSASTFRGPRDLNSRWVWADTGSGQRRLWSAFPDIEHVLGRSDVNEAVGLALQDETLNPRSDVVACVVSGSQKLTPAASQAAENSRVALLSSQAISSLFEVLAERFLSYQASSGAGSARERGAARTLASSRMPGGNWLQQLIASRPGEFIVDADVRILFDS